MRTSDLDKNLGGIVATGLGIYGAGGEVARSPVESLSIGGQWVPQ